MDNAYNSYMEARTLPKKIVDYLFNNSPDFWKLLYYETDPDTKKDLTNTQKAKMIYHNDEYL